MTTMETGSDNKPEPIILKLTPIIEILEDKTTWGPKWNDDEVALKCKNLERALDLYLNLTNAHINPGIYAQL